MKPKTTRIVLSGGVSGGHTFPLVAVARALAARPDGPYEFLFIGPKGDFGTETMTAAGIPSKYIRYGKWRRYFSLRNFIDPFLIPLGILQSLWHLFWFMPDAVFAKGGSATVPVVLAARLYRIPVLIHDSDAVAGRANRFLGRFAARVAIAYPSAREFFPEEKVALTGNPVRPELLSGSAERGAQRFALDPAKPVLVVIGGSLGASVLNSMLLSVLPELLKRGIQVLHQVGSTQFDAVREAVAAHGIETETGPYRPRAFFSAEELGDAYALASVVISRAGAGSIAEIAAYRKATVLVPLASAANDEQRMNAYEIAHIGGAVVMEEQNLTEHLILQEIDELLADGVKRRDLGEKLSHFYHPDAAEAIAEGVASLAANR